MEKLAAAFPDSSGLRQEMIRSLLSWALLLEQTGRPAEAAPARERAREIYRNLSPNDQQALIWGCCERGRKLASIGNRRQADRTYSQAFELAPTNEMARGRGQAYAELGQWDKAAADFEKAAELSADDALAQYGLALVRLHLEDRDGYRNVCSRMLERFGQSPDVNAAYWTAWTCVLAPDAVTDWQPVVQLAEKAVPCSTAPGGSRTRASA